MASTPLTRRRFVRDFFQAGAGFTLVPSHVLGRRHRPPSDALRVACIGVGGMGRNDLRGVSGEQVVALCDVDSRHLASAAMDHPDATTYADYREMLEQEHDRIDAITISIPDHSHAAAAMLGLTRGKHVYCQKPLARTLGEVRRLRDAARTAGVATQMGNQGHAREGTRQIREWVEAGWIGTVREVHYWTNRPIWPQGIDRPLEQYHVPPYLAWDLWLGPAPTRPFHPAYAHFKWRGWWDFGTGALGDMACHAMDAAFWTLDLGYPEEVVAETTRRYPETAPAVSRVEYRFGSRGRRGPIRVIWRDGGLYAERPAGLPEDAPWSWDGIGGQLWIGDEGSLNAGVYGEEPRLLDPERQAALDADPSAEVYPRTEGVYQEWIGACKGGVPAGSGFDIHAGPLSEMVLLGNLAIRSGERLRIDPATGEVLNVTLPPAYTHPTYRDGWTLGPDGF